MRPNKSRGGYKHHCIKLNGATRDVEVLDWLVVDVMDLTNILTTTVVTYW